MYLIRPCGVCVFLFIFVSEEGIDCADMMRIFRALGLLNTYTYGATTLFSHNSLLLAAVQALILSFSRTLLSRETYTRSTYLVGYM